MKKLLFAILFLVGTVNAQVVSGYYAGWMGKFCEPQEVDYDALTHVIHFSLGPNANGTLDTKVNGVVAENGSTLVMQNLISRAHAKGKKVLISIGGWWTESGWVGATSDANRSRFIGAIVGFVIDHGYDGVDIDWEPLTNTARFRTFIPELYRSLKAANPAYELTIACTGESVVGEMAEYFDQINLMTYDMSGAWPGWVVWHNSPLYNGGLTFASVPSKRLPSVQDEVDAAIGNGIPKEKIGIGIAFQGFIWYGKSAPLQDAAGASVQGNVAYFQLMKDYGLANRKWDDVAKAPYLSYPDKFVSYEDEQSIAEKIAYVKSRGLGGSIIWEIGGGYERGKAVPDKLLQAVKSSMSGVVTPPDPDPVPNPCDTVFVTIRDTVVQTVVDTVFQTITVRDTVLQTKYVTVHDTVTVLRLDTLYVNTVDTVTIVRPDTVLKYVIPKVFELHVKE